MLPRLRPGSCGPGASEPVRRPFWSKTCADRTRRELPDRKATVERSGAIEETQILQVASISERVLREDSVALAIAGFIEQRRNEATRVSAAHVNHSRAKRTQHGVAVVEKLLCGPVVRGVGRALGLDNRAPVRAIPGPVGSTLALFAQGSVDGLHLIVAACLGRVEEPLKFVRESNFEVLGRGVGELP